MQQDEQRRIKGLYLNMPEKAPIASNNAVGIAIGNASIMVQRAVCSNALSLRQQHEQHNEGCRGGSASGKRVGIKASAAVTKAAAGHVSREVLGTS